jgi:endonuclease/exonuclease/phosphatase family metal-dependent hydrolase
MLLGSKKFLDNRREYNVYRNRQTGILFWNVWGHKNRRRLNEHLHKFGIVCDVLCLTEVTKMCSEVKHTLLIYTSLSRREPPTHPDGHSLLEKSFSSRFVIHYDTPSIKDWICVKTQKKYEKIGFGSAMMIRKGLSIINNGAERICSTIDPALGRILQWVVYEKNQKVYLVAHLHGIWLKENTKGDAPLRYQQSNEVQHHLQRLSKEYQAQQIIFGGDFNLDLNTEALAILLGKGENHLTFRNLITEFDIKNTRTPNYRKYYHMNETKYADYVLVSPSIKVYDFKVYNQILASDHAPLFVSCS